MPLTLSLVAPGSQCRFLRCRARLLHASQPLQFAPTAPRTVICARRLKCFARAQLPSRAYSTVHHRNRAAQASDSISHLTLCSVNGSRRRYASSNVLPETPQDIFSSILGVDIGRNLVDQLEADGEDDAPILDGFSPVHSRRTLKRQRSSQAAMVLNSIQNEARDLYWSADPRTTDHSYAVPAPRDPGSKPRRNTQIKSTKDVRDPMAGPISLFTILSRQLRIVTDTPWVESRLERREIKLLESKGYSAKDINLWTTSLLTNDSITASGAFMRGHQSTPLFLVLLFLRRKRIRAFALGTVMRHLNVRLRAEPIQWPTLQVLVIRLLRHARMVWPESIPWIASLFCTEAARIYESSKENPSYSSKLLPNLTRFCNTTLGLISLPTSFHPVLSNPHQEKAQFSVLQFMASCEPNLTVTRSGFQAAARSQLTHAKTPQEREWAKLKGPSWPPWKENRNAMDENKDYMFGASRASRILHQLYGAGYEGRHWEKIAEVYAGWDTDSSPTIQTRTRLYQNSLKTRHSASKSILWAARVRTTRTRREAWACFLACEESGAKISQDIYLAMFEKLYYPEIENRQPQDEETQYAGTHTSSKAELLPGDMKEVLPDPKSPLHLVYLSEPVPTYDQLYHRMWQKGERPRSRLLGFLLDTISDFSTCLNLLEESKGRFNGGVRMLLEGSLLKDKVRLPVPEYFLGSFVRFLCRFGRFSHVPNQHLGISRQDHRLRLKQDETYLIDYAYTLLTHFKPAYPPAWTAYMQKLLYAKSKLRSAEIQYPIMCELFEKMNQIDLDPDDEQVQLLCAATRYIAQTAYKGQLETKNGHHVLTSAQLLLRSVFYNLVGGNVDPNATSTPKLDAHTLAPHVPGPAVFHAYVRALGILRDYEGLYSFSSWMATYHKEVTARANAQHGGRQILYKTLIALRAALEGTLDAKAPHGGAPQEIRELIKAQIEGVESWEWPAEEHVDTYVGWQANLRGG